MPSWINFQLEHRARGRKTDVWHVWSLDGRHHLGSVRWFSPWRKYSFWPARDTVFEQDCLRDLAAFIEAETVKQRKGRRAAL
ncbi:MAG: hypothetical protein ACRD59_14280 [Candidatus Acidiferrales bacterium]